MMRFIKRKMTEVNEVYLEMCRGKSFVLSKAVAAGKSGTGKECLAAISEAKTKIETKWGAKMGAGDTQDYLKPKGFKNNEKLGAEQIVMNDSLGLHHPDLDGDSKWVKAFQAYAAATKYGVLILAKTPENFQFWAKSSACLKEVTGIPKGRLFVYIEHTENDEGGVQGYICAVRRDAEATNAESNGASATVANGRGYLLWASGNYYHGDLKNGDRHGKGTNTWVDGDIYDGDYKDGKKHGKGKNTYVDGSVYYGDWKDDNMHGKGKMTFANRDIYDGDWKDDKRNGKGKNTFASGAVYDGDWVDDKKHGKGTYTWSDGGVYEGDWKGDNMHGKGKETRANGSVVHEGNWRDDEPYGK